jgi:hypothetical protein
MDLIKKIAIGVLLLIVGILFNGGIFGVLDIFFKLVLFLLAIGVIGALSWAYGKITK